MKSARRPYRQIFRAVFPLVVLVLALGGCAGGGGTEIGNPGVAGRLYVGNLENTASRTVAGEFASIWVVAVDNTGSVQASQGIFPPFVPLEPFDLRVPGGQDYVLEFRSDSADGPLLAVLVFHGPAGDRAVFSLPANGLSSDLLFDVGGVELNLGSRTASAERDLPPPLTTYPDRDFDLIPDPFDRFINDTDNDSVPNPPDFDDDNDGVPDTDDLDPFSLIEGQIEVVRSWIQYRNREDPTRNGYVGWILLRRDGQSIEPVEVNSVELRDSAGQVLPTTSQFYFTNTYILYRCTTTPCIQHPPTSETGIVSIWEEVPADLYTYHIEAADGTPLVSDVAYPGRVILPFVQASSMTAEWQAEGSLRFSWTNPIGETNWDLVNRIQLVLYASGRDVCYVALRPDRSDIVLPASLINNLRMFADFTTLTWQLQTRVYDVDGMNYARGYSGSATVPPAP